jgi:hypothetical protein
VWAHLLARIRAIVVEILSIDVAVEEEPDQ